MKKGAPHSDHIGPYRVLRQLSVTGAVQVHHAREDGPAGFLREVLLRVVPKISGDGANDMQELTSEVMACAKLTHPGIVRTRHCFEHESAMVLVVEYVHGMSLSAVMASQDGSGQRALSDDAALHVGVSICEALAHAHLSGEEASARAPIIHRAVSPSNVLLARDGSVKLDGFGFSRILGGVGTENTGSFKWTPAYMAPEQVSAQPATPKVDVYSAGLILWELLTGRTSTILPNSPFAIEATLQAVAARSPESLATLRPDLPRDIALAVDAALVSSPDKRTVSCADIARTIRKTARLDAGKRELRELVIRAHSKLPEAAAPRASALPALPERPRVPPPESRSAIRTSGAATSAAIAAHPLPPVVSPPMPAPATASQAAPPSSLNSERQPLAFAATVGLQPTRTARRRNVWLVACAGSTLGIACLVAMVFFSGAPAASANGAPHTPSPEPTAAAPAPSPIPASSAGLPIEVPVVATSSENAAPSDQPPAEPDDFSEDLMKRGLGYLIVHSSAVRANVYVNLKPYGRIEEQLSVPCGNRFVSVGLPANHPGEPLWLAPGQMMLIPCGRHFETTMNPRALRSH